MHLFLLYKYSSLLQLLPDSKYHHLFKETSMWRCLETLKHPEKKVLCRGWRCKDEYDAVLMARVTVSEMETGK